MAAASLDRSTNSVLVTPRIAAARSMNAKRSLDSAEIDLSHIHLLLRCTNRIAIV